MIFGIMIILIGLIHLFIILENWAELKALRKISDDNDTQDIILDRIHDKLKILADNSFY